MTEIINITDKLRVRDYDRAQYVLEHLTEPKKEGVEPAWKVIGYLPTPKSVHDAVRRELGTIEADIARSKAHESFDNDALSQTLLNLPEKTVKKK